MWHFVKKKNCDASTIPSRAYINHIQKNFFPRTSLEGRPTWSKIGHPGVSICRKNLFFSWPRFVPGWFLVVSSIKYLNIWPKSSKLSPSGLRYLNWETQIIWVNSDKKRPLGDQFIGVCGKERQSVRTKKNAAASPGNPWGNSQGLYYY